MNTLEFVAGAAAGEGHGGPDEAQDDQQEPQERRAGGRRLDPAQSHLQPLTRR